MALVLFVPSARKENEIMAKSLTEVALAVASIAHARDNQRRKYTNEPYIVHPIAVAGIVRDAGGSNDMICAAYLHDVIEDTNTSYAGLERVFPETIIDLVRWLTDTSTPSDGNRAARKHKDLLRLAEAPADAQTIKLADLIDNTSSIKQLDPKFWKVYRAEKIALLEVLTKGDPQLWERANQLTKATEPPLSKK